MRVVRRSSAHLYFLILLSCGVLGCLCTGELSAYTSPVETSDLPDFPESVFTRQSYFERLSGPLGEAERIEDELVDEPGEDHMVRVMARSSDEKLTFYFSNGGDFSLEAMHKGDYEITRRKSDGEFVSLKIYLKSGEESYLLLRPASEDFSRMDIYLFGRRMQRDIRVPYRFTRLLQVSFASLMESTAGYVDWDFYLPDPVISELSTAGSLARAVSPYLPSIGDTEDGAMNRDGEYVYIESGKAQEGEKGLNCSGFAKWVVDGVYVIETKEFLSVEELKVPHPDARGNRWSEKYEEEKQPYFGLDWTRNLALALKRLSQPDAGIESADVDSLTYHEYDEDVGYPVYALKTLLYELAVTEPEYFYLGSVNDLRHGEGELRVHYHVAVFFPWIDSQGRLEVSIMERGQETPVDEFMNRYSGEFVHLVRLRTDGAFTPPEKALDPLLNR